MIANNIEVETFTFLIYYSFEAPNHSQSKKGFSIVTLQQSTLLLGPKKR